MFMINQAVDGADEDEYPELEHLAEVLAERKYYETTRK